MVSDFLGWQLHFFCEILTFWFSVGEYWIFDIVFWVFSIFFVPYKIAIFSWFWKKFVTSVITRPFKAAFPLMSTCKEKKKGQEISKVLLIPLPPEKIMSDFCLCSVNLIFCCWFMVTFGIEVTKIWKYYVIFVYILQGR